MSTLLSRRVRAAAIGAAVLGAGWASAANATQVYFGNFNGDYGGATVENISGADAAFSKFGMQGSGHVNLYRSGDGGVTCGAGFTSCLSLEATDGTYGRVRSMYPPNEMGGSRFLMSAGSTVTVTFELSGNQRSPDPTTTERFTAGFDWFDTHSIDVGPITRGGAWTGISDPPSVGGVGFIGRIAAGTPFQTYTLSFVAPEDMGFYAYIRGGSPLPGGDFGGDGFGPVLDYMAVDITRPGGAPEPATWALMLTGFGGLGAALRRRRAALA